MLSITNVAYVVLCYGLSTRCVSNASSRGGLQPSRSVPSVHVAPPNATCVSALKHPEPSSPFIMGGSVTGIPRVSKHKAPRVGVNILCDAHGSYLRITSRAPCVTFRQVAFFFMGP